MQGATAVNHEIGGERGVGPGSPAGTGGLVGALGDV